MIDTNSIELRKEIGQVLTMQYDYPANGMGSVGYMGDNIYRFRVDDLGDIQLLVMERAETYRHSYNVPMLAQEIITDLLDEGLISCEGVDFMEYQKKVISI